MKRILVNGASGRIGRSVTFNVIQLSKEGAPLEIVALNDPVGIEALFRNYTRRDSTHGKLPWKVKRKGNVLYLDGCPVQVFTEKDPSKIPLGDKGIHIVEECSGMYAKEDAAMVFLRDGVERVILSYPAKGKQYADQYAMLIMGVNHKRFSSRKHRCISNASCTTKALAAPLAILLDHGVGIEALLMDTVHAATNSQHVLDFGDDYAALNQIVTAKTGAAIATGEVIPNLKGRMDGLAFRVPTTDGSFANLYFVASFKGEFTAEKLNKILRRHARDADYAGRIALHKEEEAASADIIGRTENAIVITSKTRVFALPYTFKRKKAYLVSLVSGYDNELGPPRDQALLTKYIAGR